jgi:chromosome segregation ATPase
MANAEIEKTLKKITDTQLVVVRLMETSERKWEKRFQAERERTGDLEKAAAHLHRSIDKLWHVADAHERRLDSHERRLNDGADRTAALQDEVRTMVASVDRLIKTIEDFAKGRKRENGHG